MRVFLVHVSRCVADERHPSLFADASVRQDRAERMPQAAEGERADAATAVRGALADNAAVDVCQCDQLTELLTERTRPAPGQRRKDIFVVALRRWQGQQIIFQRRMNDRDDFRSGFAHLKANGLDVGDKIDIAPAKVRAIQETLHRIERQQYQTAPVAFGGFQERSDLLWRKHALALWFVLEWFNRQTWIDRNVPLSQRGVERAAQDRDIDIDGRRSQSERVAMIAEAGDVAARDG